MTRFVRPVTAVVVSFLAAAVGVAQRPSLNTDVRQPRPANLDFEANDAGGPPTGWSATTTLLGYPAIVTDERPHSGKRSAMLRSEPGATGFGNLMQAIDATSFRGHRIRFRAAVRVERSDAAVRTFAQLWMRVDRAAGRRGFFDNMSDRPVFSTDWTLHEIVGDVDEDADVLNIGMMLQGQGKAWIDTASIEDLGKLTVLAEPARPVAQRGLQNLSAFARLLGYVRHFHPSDQAASTDWNAFAVAAVREVESARTADDLATKLRSVFAPIAPTVRVFSAPQKTRVTEPAPEGIDPANLKVMQWRHRGFGGAATGMNIYRSERVSGATSGGTVPDGFHDPRSPLVLDLGAGVTASIPLAVFADGNGTLPRVEAPPASAKATLVKYSGNDRATRIAGVVLAWNVFQHFYPYFDVVKTDWQSMLGRCLTTAATDADEEAYANTLRTLVAALHDGHGGVTAPGSVPLATFPVLWNWIEDRLVVTHVASEAAGRLQRGDVILTLDDKPARAAVAEAERLISTATPQWARFRALRQLASGPKGSVVTLAVQKPSGEQASVKLTRTLEAAPDEPRPAKVAELEPGIMYFDLGRTTDADFKAGLDRMVKATGVVFDLRGYPSVSPDVLRHLTDKPIQSARWNVPIIDSPEWRSKPQYDTAGRWMLQPAEPRITGRIIFLTDGRAISYAESWMGIVEAYRLGDIVGEPTAGTNGNVNPFVLPGNYRLAWTGMLVLKHDGSQHHGIGIHPTIPVTRTIAGVAAGRDEQLERAIRLIKAPPSREALRRGYSDRNAIIGSIVDARRAGR